MPVNINVITENHYFFVGIKEHLQDEERVVSKINLYELKNIPKKRFSVDEIFIFYTSNYMDELSFLISTNSFPGRLIVIPINSKVKFNAAFNKHIFLDSHAGIDVVVDKITDSLQDVEYPMDLMKDKLTEREKTILLHTMNGMNAYSIGQFLRISIKTVYAHRRNAFLKLGGRNMFEIWPVRKETLSAAIF